MARRVVSRLAAILDARARPPRRALSSFSPAVQAQLSRLEARHAELQELLAGGSVAPRELPRLSRESSALDKAVGAIARYRAAHAEVASLEQLVRDADEATSGTRRGESDCGAGAAAEIARMAAEELSSGAQPQLAEAEQRLVRLLLPADEADGRAAILEVRAGVGGEEAALFAGELLRMYEAYCAARGWQWRVMSVATEPGFGGVREAVVALEGEGIYGRLKFESGVHRVQRVPVTQSTGKLQTSTATVAVLPEAEEVDIEVRPADLRIDTYRAGGAGGQHVNTTDSAVRITHVPSGLTVAIQDERSQIQNRAKALRVLRARLFEAERDKLDSARREARSAQVGSSARSERVRTYNFSQNRVTDHRCGESRYDVAAYMRGEELDSVIDALAKQREEEELAGLEARFKAAAAAAPGGTASLSGASAASSGSAAAKAAQTAR